MTTNRPSPGGRRNVIRPDTYIRWRAEAARRGGRAALTWVLESEASPGEASSLSLLGLRSDTNYLTQAETLRVPLLSQLAPALVLISLLRIFALVILEPESKPIYVAGLDGEALCRLDGVVDRGWE